MGKNDFWSAVKIYAKPGNNAAELYHGEESYFLKGLSKIVGSEGIVYGIDPLNPFKKSAKMRSLSKLENVELIKSKFPNLPSGIKNLDVVLIRDFLLAAYKIPFDGTSDPNVFRSFSKILKKRGNMILNVNRTEIENYLKVYNKSIKEYLPNFKKVFNSTELIVYKKLK
ncbi:MAG: hypothetical protein Q8Q04_03000 [archaeon]|nr:hypothetical protein [archaeon]